MSAGEPEAAHAENNLQLELSCPICLQLFSEPMSLPCGHVYCSACLQTMETDVDHHCCPECQAEYHGIKALTKNFKMCSIVENYKATNGKINSTASLSGVVVKVQSDADGGGVEIPVTTDPQQPLKSTQSQEDAVRGPLDDLKISEHDDALDKNGTRECPVSVEEECQAKVEMTMFEPKFRLASQVTELTLKLEMAESTLTKEKEKEMEMNTANAQLREGAAVLLQRVTDLSLNYSAEVRKLMETELRPGEGSMSGRVGQATKQTEQLRRALVRAESLLTEEDGTVFSEHLHGLQPHIAKLLAKPLEELEEPVESKINSARACSKLEEINDELKAGLTEVLRSFRNVFNPSEVTFDLDTAHPNLVLSADSKTVTFSAKKQPYPASPKRFISFIQVLSTQRFYGGEHCWEVELDGAPWIIGVCYSGKLARSGLPSALESSRGSWCLMWFENQLRAFEEGHSVPLMRTAVACRLEIKLSFKTHSLSFYSVSPTTSGKTHVYTFKVDLTEPVHLAYRMMSGQPKACVTIKS